MSDDSKKNLQTQLKLFWQKQAEDIKKLCEENSDFKNHNDLPLARIKRIMKSDEDVRMIRAEAPVLFAKACELFILELTLRAYCNSENTDRRNLQKEDIFAAVKNTDIFDFLDDVLTEKVQLEAEKAKAAAAAASLKSESWEPTTGLYTKKYMKIGRGRKLCVRMRLGEVVVSSFSSDQERCSFYNCRVLFYKSKWTYYENYFRKL